MLGNELQTEAGGVPKRRGSSVSASGIAGPSMETGEEFLSFEGHDDEDEDLELEVAANDTLVVGDGGPAYALLNGLGLGLVAPTLVPSDPLDMENQAGGQPEEPVLTPEQRELLDRYNLALASFGLEGSSSVVAEVPRENGMVRVKRVADVVPPIDVFRRGLLAEVENRNEILVCTRPRAHEVSEYFGIPRQREAIVPKPLHDARSRYKKCLRTEGLAPEQAIRVLYSGQWLDAELYSPLDLSVEELNDLANRKMASVKLSDGDLVKVPLSRVNFRQPDGREITPPPPQSAQMLDTNGHPLQGSPSPVRVNVTMQPFPYPVNGLSLQPGSPEDDDLDMSLDSPLDILPVTVALMAAAAQPPSPSPAALSAPVAQLATSASATMVSPSPAPVPTVTVSGIVPVSTLAPAPPASVAPSSTTTLPSPPAEDNVGPVVPSHPNPSSATTAPPTAPSAKAVGKRKPSEGSQGPSSATPDPKRSRVTEPSAESAETPSPGTVMLSATQTSEGGGRRSVGGGGRLSLGFERYLEDLRGLEERNIELEAIVEGHNSENARLLAEAQEARTAFDQLQGSHRQLQTSHQQLQTSHQQLQTSHQQLQNSYQQLQTSQEHLQASTQQLQNEHQRLRTAKAELDTSHLELQGRYQDLESRLERSQDDARNMEASLRADVASWQERHEGLLRQLEQFRTGFSSAVNQQLELFKNMCGEASRSLDQMAEQARPGGPADGAARDATLNNMMGENVRQSQQQQQQQQDQQQQQHQQQHLSVDLEQSRQEHQHLDDLTMAHAGDDQHWLLDPLHSLLPGLQSGQITPTSQLQNMAASPNQLQHHLNQLQHMEEIEEQETGMIHHDLDHTHDGPASPESTIEPGLVQPDQANHAAVAAAAAIAAHAHAAAAAASVAVSSASASTTRPRGRPRGRARLSAMTRDSMDDRSISFSQASTSASRSGRGRGAKRGRGSSRVTDVRELHDARIFPEAEFRKVSDVLKEGLEKLFGHGREADNKYQELTACSQSEKMRRIYAPVKKFNKMNRTYKMTETGEYFPANSYVHQNEADQVAQLVLQNVFGDEYFEDGTLDQGHHHMATHDRGSSQPSRRTSTGMKRQRRSYHPAAMPADENEMELQVFVAGAGYGNGQYEEDYEDSDEIEGHHHNGDEGELEEDIDEMEGDDGYEEEGYRDDEDD